MNRALLASPNVDVASCLLRGQQLRTALKHPHNLFHRGHRCTPGPHPNRAHQPLNSNPQTPTPEPQTQTDCIAKAGEVYTCPRVCSKFPNTCIVNFHLCSRFPWRETIKHPPPNLKRRLHREGGRGLHVGLQPPWPTR